MLRELIIAASKTVDRVAALVCILLFCICLYATIDAVKVYYEANDRSMLKYKPALGQDPGVMREISDDVVAWLTVDDTPIDYPVMQGKTNNDYLNKDPYGEYSLSGSIFLDSRNAGDFSDPYSLIYGHHMEYGAMFGSLDEFANPRYLDEHASGTLVSVAGERDDITLFASCKALSSEPLIFDPPESDNAALATYLQAHALVYKPQPLDQNTRVIALSTCQGADTTERMIVFGLLTPEAGSASQTTEGEARS